ncbi:MAG: cytochrome c [Candidatus Korobacteraceae bacterium]
MSRTKLIVSVVLLTMVAGGIAFWVFLRRGFSAHDEPSAIEVLLARTTRRLATPGWAAELTNSQPPMAANMREGLEHFADHCAICHANNGSGDTDFGRNMYPKTPDLRRSQTQQLTDGEIYYIIENGVRLTGMPAFGEGKRRDNVASWNLVLFIRHLPELTPSEQAAMERLNPKTLSEWQQLQEAENFLGGAEQGPSSETEPHQH